MNERLFFFLYHVIKKELKGRKQLSVLFQVSNERLVNESTGLSVGELCVQCGRLMVVPDKLVSNLNAKEDSLLRKHVEAGIIRCVMPRVFAS